MSKNDYQNQIKTNGTLFQLIVEMVHNPNKQVKPVNHPSPCLPQKPWGRPLYIFLSLSLYIYVRMLTLICFPTLLSTVQQHRFRAAFSSYSRFPGFLSISQPKPWTSSSRKSTSCGGGWRRGRLNWPGRGPTMRPSLPMEWPR